MFKISEVVADVGDLLKDGLHRLLCAKTVVDENGNIVEKDQIGVALVKRGLVQYVGGSIVGDVSSGRASSAEESDESSDASSKGE